MVRLYSNGNIDLKNDTLINCSDDIVFSTFCNELMRIQCFDIEHSTKYWLFMCSNVHNRVYRVSRAILSVYKQGKTVKLKAVKPSDGELQAINTFFS